MYVAGMPANLTLAEPMGAAYELATLASASDLPPLPLVKELAGLNPPLVTASLAYNKENSRWFMRKVCPSVGNVVYGAHSLLELGRCSIKM